MEKYIILQIEGGIGKNVVATSVVRAISKHYPDRKIIILTAHIDIWFCNPRIYKVLEFGKTPYFYQDYVQGKDTVLMIQEPYRSEDYIYRRKHLSEIWCNLYNIEWDGEKPELYFTNLEFDLLSTIINKTKPIFLIQPFGGAPVQGHKYSWARDIPPQIAQQIVDEMSKEYRVIQVKRDDQISLNNCEYLSLNPRQLAMSILLSDKRLFIDSYMQHAASALNLSSTVLWVVNDPNILGYNLHTNIASNFNNGDLRNSMYDAHDIMGDPIQLASIPNDLFDIKKILEKLK
jgi:hypothetical protein